MTLLKLAAVLSALALSGCVIAPLPLHPYRAHGYSVAPPVYWGGEIHYYGDGPRHGGWRHRGQWRRW